MIESLKTEIAQHGDRGTLIPIDRLQDIQQSVAELREREALNGFQRFITGDLYNFDLPAVDFEIRSILVTATPSAPAIRLGFQREGKTIQTLIPASYTRKNSAPVRIGTYLNEFLNPQGCHAVYAPKLPHKLTAVRSGLGRYGRNNICYVEGMGSFLNLNLFFTDIVCPEHTWQDVRAMDACAACTICRQSCPTGAILPERFLIDNERCLTYFNEAGGEWDFPAWIDPAAHHTLYGCLRCQMACPEDRPFWHTAFQELDFSEEETALLMASKPLEGLPEGLRSKVQELEMEEYLGVLPRNLRVLFARNGRND